MILTNAKLATMSGRVPYGLNDNATPGAIAIAGEKIAWLGREQDLPEKFASSEQLDLSTLR